MIEVDQYILLFIQAKTEEMEEFKDYIKVSILPNRKISYDEWETVYLNWAIRREESIEKAGKMPKIYLSED
jgi:hypothetical protein